MLNSESLILLNQHNNKLQRGFTIVELLIVIVIIGILAALVIVAYNGIQNRAKTATGQSLANIIVKKAEAFNSINSMYPTRCQMAYNQTNATAGTQVAGNTGTTNCTAGTTPAGVESKLDSTSALAYSASATGADYTSTISNGNAVVGYYSCAAGANIYYWDFTKSSSNVSTTKAGAGC